MAEKELVLKEKIEHSGLFDFPAFYSFAHSWFKETGYGVVEEKYSEKVEGSKRDISIGWKAMKNLSDYFKIEHAISFSINDLTEVEVEVDGQRKKMNKGRVAVDLKGNLIKDRESKWETSSFSRFMRDVYNKYVIPAKVNEIKEIVEGDIRNFKEELKAFLDLVGKR